MTRILVTGPSWVGDMVMAQALFRRLKRLKSDAEIHVIAPGWSAPLTARMPEVAQSHILDIPHGTFGFAARRALGKQLRGIGFDEAYILPRAWKSALVPFFASATKRVGYRGEMRFGLLNQIVPRIAQAEDGAAKPRTVDEFVTLGDPKEPRVRNDEMPVIIRDADSESATRDAFGIRPGTRAVALCPGAEYGPAKQWPVEYFTDTARQLAKSGHEVWVVGSQKERAAAEAIATAGQHVRVTAGGTTLAQAMDLLAMSDAVVSNDSGLMHVAAAQQRPVVAVFGSSSEKVTPPLSNTAHVLSRDLECRPCFQRTCPLGHLNCLKQITPDDVMGALGPALRT